MDVLLFRPKTADHDYSTKSVPWNLLYIASFLEQKGFSVKIIDELVDKNWVSILNKSDKPLIVGVSVMTGLQIKYALLFSKWIKEKLGVPVFWGGVHPTSLPEQTLKHELIDFVIKGDGEETLFELLQALKKKKSLENIDGLGFKKSGRIIINKNRNLFNLSSLKKINFNLINLDDFILRDGHNLQSFDINTSRGCYFNCSFCVNKLFSHISWRSIKLELLFRMVEQLVKEYGVNHIHWMELDFFSSKTRVKKIMFWLIKQNFNITWDANCRIDNFEKFDDEFITLMKQSGCVYLTFGVESGSNKILKKLNKKLTREQVLNVENKLVKNKIDHYFQFMIGVPTETKEDMSLTASLVYNLIRKNPYLKEIYGPNIYTPYPGTDLYFEALKQGFVPPKKLEGWFNFHWDGVNLDWLSLKEKKFAKSLSFNIKGIYKEFPFFSSRKRLLSKYFFFKLFLLVKFGINIPYFEGFFFDFLKKFKF
jgi:anaerobic magnesium-protoporphyrin IX monomethyl ester cyclase